MTFHSREEVETLPKPFEIHVLKEQDEDGAAMSAPSLGNVFHVIASKHNAD
jgi:hypothetical protein